MSPYTKDYCNGFRFIIAGIYRNWAYIFKFTYGYSNASLSSVILKF